MIYVYHNIKNDKNDENAVSLRDFRRQMKQLFLSGKQVVHIHEYDMNNPNQAVITFDDGYISILKAIPVLRRYKFPFEVYLVGDWFAKLGFISPHDIEFILKSGGRLQWHTKTHCDLTQCPNITDELTVPEDIQNLDKNGFDSVAYPFWKSNTEVESIAANLFHSARSGNGYSKHSRHSVDAIKVKRGMNMTDKIVKFIDVTAPTWPCNFRCHYCYVGQQMSDSERAVVNKCKYNPDEFAKAISKKRLGGTCVFNFCSFGETLILPQNVEYCKKILEQGHFIGIVTNMTITKHIQELLSLPAEQLSRLFFKCSFHYIELKKQGLLDTFVKNVNDAWKAGASITVEITPSDELEPYIDEVKEFSIKHFGALPHITIGRNELKPGYVRLTKHTEEEYNKIWGQFDSELFRFKTHIWEKKIKDFCYAGKWGYGIDLGTGKLYICSHRQEVGDLTRGRKVKQKPVCKKCPATHCFNGHAWLAWGMCPSVNNTSYADVRDRVRTDGSHWLHPRVHDAFSQKLWQNNKQYGKLFQWIKNIFA